MQLVYVALLYIFVIFAGDTACDIKEEVHLPLPKFSANTRRMLQANKSREVWKDVSHDKFAHFGPPLL
jgi:hypothetical protein